MGMRVALHTYLFMGNLKGEESVGFHNLLDTGVFVPSSVAGSGVGLRDG